MTVLPELTVAVSTIGARGLQLAPERLPRADGVRFLVLVQLPVPAPEGLEAHLQHLAARPDIEVRRLEGSRGAARSRNAAIAAAETPLLLFADDDQGFDPAGWQQLRQLFAARPQLDFLCARLRVPEGGWRKPYGPERIRPARRLNCLKLGTPEMALRLAPVRAAGVQFDPRFGAGGQWPAGDEFIFASDCLTAGLRGCHVPVGLGEEVRANGGMAIIDELHQKHMGMKYLGWVDSGVKFHIYINEAPKFTDGGLPDLKGVKMRDNPIYGAFFRALDAETHQMAATDVYPALQKGVVNASAWTSIGVKALKWDEFLRHRLDPDFYQTDIGIIMNLDKWNGLDTAAQKLLQDTVIAHELSSRKAREAEVIEEKKQLESEGMQVHAVPSGDKYLEIALESAYGRIKERLEKDGRPLEAMEKLRGLYQK